MGYHLVFGVNHFFNGLDVELSGGLARCWSAGQVSQEAHALKAREGVGFRFVVVQPSRLVTGGARLKGRMWCGGRLQRHFARESARLPDFTVEVMA